MDAEEASFMTAQELMMAHIVSMALKAAMDLGLIDALSAAPAGGSGRTAAELAAQALPRPPANKAKAEDAVERILRFLAAHGVVTCSTEDDGTAALRRYAATPVCRWLSSSSNHSEASLAALATVGFQPALFNPWQYMAEAVLDDGVAFEMANNGMPPMVYFEKNPHLSGLFNKAMSQTSVLVCEKMLQRFTGFGDDGIRTIVDVAGGSGTVLGLIISRYKHLKGINFDLPFVIAQAKPIPGVEHVGGNMHEEVPKGDAIFMKSVLHMMDDERCVTLLKNCYRSLPENGKVMVMDQVLPVEPEATQAGRFPFMFDMVCLVSDSKGGRERTEREFARLAMDAGFRGAFRSNPIFGGFWVLEFTK